MLPRGPLSPHGILRDHSGTTVRQSQPTENTNQSQEYLKNWKNKFWILLPLFLLISYREHACVFQAAEVYAK